MAKLDNAGIPAGGVGLYKEIGEENSGVDCTGRKVVRRPGLRERGRRLSKRFGFKTPSVAGGFHFGKS